MAVAMTLIVLAACLLVVPAAHAAEPVHWVTGAYPGTELQGEESLGSQAVGTSVFHGSLYGVSEVYLEAKNIEGVGLTIQNTSSSGAVAVGRLRLTGISLRGSNCKIEPTSLSAPLTFRFENVAGRAYVEIVPTAGPSTYFFLWETYGCALETSMTVKGAMRGEFVNSLGATLIEQEVHFSNEGMLHIGSYPQSFNSYMNFHMTGGLSGTPFGLR